MRTPTLFPEEPFTSPDGLVLGSRNFVQDVLTRHRARLTRKREIVLRAMAGGDWGGLQVLRHPRGAPIAVLRSS